MEPDYLERLASASPTPGGGSAATVVAAMGAALVAMAARITGENPKYAPEHALARRLVAQADALREKLIAARARDEAAFDAVMKSRGEGRRRALREAAQAPLDAMRDALEVERLALEAKTLGNPHLASDLICAAEFAAAAIAALAINVGINHRWLKDDAIVATQRNEMQRYERESSRLLRAMRGRE